MTGSTRARTSSQILKARPALRKSVARESLSSSPHLMFRRAGRWKKLPTAQSISMDGSSVSRKISSSLPGLPGRRRTSSRQPVHGREIARLINWRRHQSPARWRHAQICRAYKTGGIATIWTPFRSRRRGNSRRLEQGSESQRNETVGKLSWSKANLAGFSFEMGGEAALNTLDYNLDLYVLELAVRATGSISRSIMRRLRTACRILRESGQTTIEGYPS